MVEELSWRRHQGDEGQRVYVLLDTPTLSAMDLKPYAI